MVYVVLDDLSTFSGVDGAVVAVLTEAGLAEVDSCSDFKAIDICSERHVESLVTIGDLLDAYNQVHGTNL